MFPVLCKMNPNVLGKAAHLLYHLFQSVSKLSLSHFHKIMLIMLITLLIIRLGQTWLIWEKCKCNLVVVGDRFSLNSSVSFPCDLWNIWTLPSIKDWFHHARLCEHYKQNQMSTSCPSSFKCFVRGVFLHLQLYFQIIEIFLRMFPCVELHTSSFYNFMGNWHGSAIDDEKQEVVAKIGKQKWKQEKNLFRTLNSISDYINIGDSFHLTK